VLLVDTASDERESDIRPTGDARRVPEATG